MSKALIDSDISHEEFQIMINNKQNYFRLTKSTIVKDSRLGDTERNKLIEHHKRVGIDEILKRNDRQV